MTFTDQADFEPAHAASPTGHLLDELQLYGCRPHQEDPDPRPLPEEATVRGALADIFDALVATLSETRLEPDLDDLLWSTVNLFHRAGDRVTRELDGNEDAQKRSQKEQDGSEIRSVELERLTAQGRTLLERRNSDGILPRPRRRSLRGAYRLVLAAGRRARRSTIAPSPRR